jgi:hypothetical protein
MTAADDESAYRDFLALLQERREMRRDPERVSALELSANHYFDVAEEFEATARQALDDATRRAYIQSAAVVRALAERTAARVDALKRTQAEPGGDLEK